MSRYNQGMTKVVKPTNPDVRSMAIDVATAIVRRQGSEKFRLTDVAKEMGMTHAALYKYFENKADLLDNINATWLHRIDDELEAIVHRDEEVLTRMKHWFMRLYEMKREKAQLDIEPYIAFVDAAAEKKPYVREHLAVQFRQLNQLCEEAAAVYNIKADTKKVAELLLDATISFHHPKFIKDTMNTDRKDNLFDLLDILLLGIFIKIK